MLRTHGGISLVAGSALFCALYGARVAFTRELTFGFLLFNLALAWIPWLAACAVSATERSWIAWLCALVWLLFLPNAPYLVTDFVHLRPRAGVPLWYDLAMLASAALTGLIAGAYSLRSMQRAVALRYGRVAGLLLVAACIPATGLGIYLGRFERFSSWDLFLDPIEVLRSIAHVFRSPRALVVSGAFASLSAVAYLAVAGSVSAGVPHSTERSMLRPTR